MTKQSDWSDIMTMQELIPLLIEDGRYFTEGETQVPKFVQARTHKKWRINKKWKKRFGEKLIYETNKTTNVMTCVRCFFIMVL